MARSETEIITLNNQEHTYQYDTKKNTYAHTEKVYIDGNSSYYTVTIPDEISENTYIHIHADGSGGGRAETNVPKILERVGTNAIIVSPSAGYRTENWGSSAVNAVSVISKKYGVSPGNVSFSGWSGGTGNAIDTYVEYVKTNPETEKMSSIFFLDSVSDLISTQERRKNILDQDGVRDIFKEYRPVIFTYQTPDSKTAEVKEAEMIDFAEAGAIPVRVKIIDLSNGHDGVNDDFFATGMHDFESGKANLALNSQNEHQAKKGQQTTYVYEVLVGYDKSSPNQNDWVGEWVMVPYDVISDKKKLERFLLVEHTSLNEQQNILGTLGKISLSDNDLYSLSNSNYNLLSDRDLVACCVNEISSSISSTSIVKSNLVSGFSGNTNVPTGIPSVIQNFSSSTSKLLMKISDDLNSITKIAYSIEIMDKNASKDASVINDVVAQLSEPN